MACNDAQSRPRPRRRSAQSQPIGRERALGRRRIVHTFNDEITLGFLAGRVHTIRLISRIRRGNRPAIRIRRSESARFDGNSGIRVMS
jgi:hypothetical protein